MNENSDLNAPVVKRPIYQLWLDAVMKPTIPNFEGLAAEPGVSVSTAALWLFLALVVGSVLGGLIALPFGPAGIPDQLGPLFNNVPPESREMLRTILGSRGGQGFFGVICGAPVAAVIGIIFYYIGIAIQSWLARLFGGTGAFDKFFIVNATFYAPIVLATSILGNIPFINCISIFISLYALYLNFIALQAVHKLTAGKAIMVILIPALLVCVLFACIAFVGLAVLGPIIGNVFERINENIGK